MVAFARFTQKARGEGDWDTYGRAVRLAATLLPDADAELRDELHVAYLEHLDFDGPRGPTAWSLLPGNLQRAWHEIINYNERLISAGRGFKPSRSSRNEPLPNKRLKLPGPAFKGRVRLCARQQVTQGRALAPAGRCPAA